MAHWNFRPVFTSPTVIWLAFLTLALPAMGAADVAPSSVLPVVRGGRIDFPVDHRPGDYRAATATSSSR